MRAGARLATAEEVLPLRVRYRDEMACQIVHDSIHSRRGWTMTYLLEHGGAAAGFGSVAIAGPWTDKSTIFEFYVLPEHRLTAFDLFEALLTASGSRLMEVQSNDSLLAVMLHTYAKEIVTESIVFRDEFATNLSGYGATLLAQTPIDEIQTAIERRQGGPQWLLQVDGATAGNGGILFHYNRPYGDIYMEIAESFRQRGLGAFLVQELKRQAYNLSAIPAARCNPRNLASRRTLQKAGFVPYAHILDGVVP
jgi:GNAT superfamily N-acetyltransferase